MVGRRERSGVAQYDDSGLQGGLAEVRYSCLCGEGNVLWVLCVGREKICHWEPVWCYWG